MPTSELLLGFLFGGLEVSIDYKTTIRFVAPFIDLFLFNRFTVSLEFNLL